MQVWDIISPADLTVFSRQVPDIFPNALTGPGGWLPPREVQDIRARAAKSTRRNVTAQFRSWNAETPIGVRPATLSITEVAFPPIGQKIPLTEGDRLQMALLESGGTAGSPALERVIQQIYDDVENNVQAIRNRVELAGGDVLLDGKFTLTAENGLTVEADFGLPGGHVVTAGTLWSNVATATPLSDEQTWMQTVVTDSGQPVTRAMTSLTVLNYLLRNAEYRAAYWGGNAGQQPNLNRDQLNGVRASNGLPPIEVYDHQLEVNGSNTRVLPVNRFWLGTDGIGETQWGITPDSLDLVQTGALVRRDAPGIISGAYHQIDPLTKWTKSTAAVLPVLADPNRLLVATVA